MSHTLRSLAIVFAGLLFTGCTTTWKATDGSPLDESKYGYQYVPPGGWYILPYRGFGGSRQFTRDGSSLQTISTGRYRLKKAFRALEKDASPDMLPQELAETYLAELKTQIGNDRLDVLANEPATLGSLPGIRLLVEYRTEEGLRYRSVHYAATSRDGLYLVWFQAPTLHYFDRHVDEFEASLQSFRIL